MLEAAGGLTETVLSMLGRCRWAFILLSPSSKAEIGNGRATFGCPDPQMDFAGVRFSIFWGSL